MKKYYSKSKGVSFPKFEINEEELQVIVGSTLGDGCIRILRAGIRPFFRVGHKFEHGEYTKWKAEKLKRFQPHVTIQKKKRTFQSVVLTTRVNENLTSLRQLFYPEGKKVVPKELLYRLTGLGLAVWYMDDGSYSKRNRNARLHTCGFSKEDVEMVQEFLEKKFGIKANLISKNSLGFPVKEANKLIDIVENHIHPCFEYKIGG